MSEPVYPPFRLSPSEAETLIRLAAAACDERMRFAHPQPLEAALASFTNPDEVCSLGIVTWQCIENGR